MKKLLLPFVLLFALCGCLSAPEKQVSAEQEQSGFSVRGGTVQHVRGVKIPNRSDKNSRDTDGLEITVQLDNGQELVLVQEADDFFKKGDRVRIITSSNGTARVQNE